MSRTTFCVDVTVTENGPTLKEKKKKNNNNHTLVIVLLLLVPPVLVQLVDFDRNIPLFCQVKCLQHKRLVITWFLRFIWTIVYFFFKK